jgi:hypothetical protein
MMSKPKLVETLVGELLCSGVHEGKEMAEVILYEPDRQSGLPDEYYLVPLEHFRGGHNIADGDEFFFEVYDNGTGKIVPKIVYGPWQHLEEGYLTREQLEALDDPW